jgi:hypothetical protein
VGISGGDGFGGHDNFLITRNWALRARGFFFTSSYEGKHKAIITKKLFDDVQTVFDRRKHKRTTKTNNIILENSKRISRNKQTTVNVKRIKK